MNSLSLSPSVNSLEHSIPFTQVTNPDPSLGNKLRLSPAMVKRSLRELKELFQREDLFEGIPAGNGSPVMFFPSFPWGDISGHLLFAFLKRLGYGVHLLKLRSWASTEQLRENLIQRVQEVAAMEGPVTIIAHGKGGIFARDIVIHYPDYVQQVIYLGIPKTPQRNATEKSQRYLPKIYRNSSSIMDELQKNMKMTPTKPAFTICNPLDRNRFSDLLPHLSTEGFADFEISQIALLFSPDVFRKIGFFMAEKQ
ncbi:MAG: hypothetical protein HQM12_21410 [SAR324 cluster bacterium]|nr:hypothetical protein [SAR324 cluster bacterium]